MRSRPDAIVVGGGLAGAAAAFRLAQEGRRTVLFERNVHPCDKVCGEFINPQALAGLRALGVDPGAYGAASIDRLQLVRGGQVIEHSLPAEALSLSRRRLDEALLVRARAVGAAVRRGVSVSGLRPEPGGWRVELANGPPLRAGAVFLASGKHDLRGWQREGGRQTEFIGFKRNYRLLPAQTEKARGRIALFLFEGGYAGLEPIEDGKFNLCLVIHKVKFAEYNRDWFALLQALGEHAPLFKERMEGAVACHPAPLAIYGIPYGYVFGEEAPSGLYRLGDQMAVIPSFCGGGMAIALYTARQAVSSFLYGGRLSYHEEAARTLRPLIRRTTLLSQALAVPALNGALFSLCRVAPGLLGSFMKMADTDFGAPPPGPRVRRSVYLQEKMVEEAG